MHAEADNVVGEVISSCDALELIVHVRVLFLLRGQLKGHCLSYEAETEDATADEKHKRACPGHTVDTGFCSALTTEEGRRAADTAHTFAFGRVQEHQCDYSHREQRRKYQ